jgi:hypothetical protein
VGEHAHEAVARDRIGRERVAADRKLGDAIGDLIGFGDGAAEPVARRRTLDQAVPERATGE